MEIIGWILAFIIAITIHEASHAFTSDRLGDPTARLMGRLSLNPLAHYDPVGTTLLIFLIFLRAMGYPVIPFGWAKPVQYDSYNLKNPRKDAALIALSGPAANILLAILASLLIRFTGSFLVLLLTPVIILNCSLAIFNLIPIHPLDGGKIFIGFLPEKDATEAELFLQRYGLLILLFLIFPTIRGVSPISIILSPILQFILKVLLPYQVFM